MRKMLALMAVPVMAAVGFLATPANAAEAKPSVSAMPLNIATSSQVSSHPYPCDSDIPFGGSCHYWLTNVGVKGSTGAMQITLYYGTSTSGASFKTYKWRLCNNTSRTQQPTAAGSASYTIEEWQGPSTWPIDNNTYGGIAPGVCFGLREGGV